MPDSHQQSTAGHCPQTCWRTTRTVWPRLREQRTGAQPRDRQTDGRTDGRTDGTTDKGTHGSQDGQMDKQLGSHLSQLGQMYFWQAIANTRTHPDLSWKIHIRTNLCGICVPKGCTITTISETRVGKNWKISCPKIHWALVGLFCTLIRLSFWFLETCQLLFHGTFHPNPTTKINEMKLTRMHSTRFSTRSFQWEWFSTATPA